MADLYYYEEGYIDVSYHVYVADAEIALGPYIEENYIDANYYDDYSAVSSLTCELTLRPGETVSATGSWTSAFTQSATVGRLQSATADFTSAFSPTLTVDAFKNSFAVLDVTVALSSTAVATRSTNVLLEHIADLNAMAAKTVDILSPITATASISSAPTKSVVSSATLTSTATFTCEAFNVQFGTAAFVSTTNTFTSRYFGTGRPRNALGITSYTTADKKFGTASINGVTAYSETTLDIPSRTTAWCVEFWIKAPTLITKDVITFTQGGTGSKFFTLGITSGARLILTTYKPAKTTTFTSQATYNYTGWTHVAVVYNPTGSPYQLAVFADGIRRIEESLPTFDPSNQQWTGFGTGTTVNVDANSIYVDDVRISYDTPIYDINNNFTAPSSANTNDPDTTQLLWHLDQTNADDVSVQLSGSAAFASTASVTAQANTSTKQAAASLASTVTVSAIGNKAVLVNSALSSASSLTATIGLVKGIVSSQTATVTVAAQALRIKQFSVNAGALFSPNIIINVILNPFATLESTATVSVTAVKITGITKTLTAAVTQSTVANKFAGITKTLSATASVTAIAGFRKSFASAVTAQAALTAIAITPTLATATLSAFFNCIPFISRTFGTGRPRPLISNGGELADISAVGVNSVTVDQQGEYIRIPADQGLQNFGVLEFWFAINKDPNNINSYSGGPSEVTNSGWAAPLITYGQDSNYIFRLRVRRDNDTASIGNYYILYDDSTAEDSDVVNDSALTLNSDGSATWFKVRVTRTADNNLDVKLYNQSGTELGNHQGNYNDNVPAWSQGITFWALDLKNLVWNGSAYVSTYVRTRPLWIDEILLTNINGVTNSLQTQPWLFNNQADVLALYHFDGIAPYEWQGGSGTFYNQDDYSIRQTFIANLQTTVTQTTTALKVVSSSANLSSAFTHTATAVVRRNGVMSVNATLTQTASGDRNRLTAVTLSTTAVQITQPRKFVGYFSVNNTIVATQTILGTRIRFATPQLEAIATNLTAAFKNATGTVTLESTATFAATVRKVTDQPIALSASATLDVDAQKIIVNGSTAGVIASLTTEATRIQPVASAIVATATLTATAIKRTGIVANVTATATVSGTVLRIRRSAVTLASAVTVTVNNQILRLAQAQLNSQFTPLFTVTKLIQAQAALSSQGFILTAGEVINIDPYLTITVEPETRLWKIDAESRIIVIEQETRVNIV